jgi:hypothetical protein
MTQQIGELRTPEEVCGELENNGYLTADQALYVAQEVYQPLYLCIKELGMMIDQIDKRDY